MSFADEMERFSAQWNERNAPIVEERPRAQNPQHPSNLLITNQRNQFHFFDNNNKLIEKQEDGFILLKKTIDERNNPEDINFVALFDGSGERKGVWFIVKEIKEDTVKDFHDKLGRFQKEECFQFINQKTEKNWIYFSDRYIYDLENRLIVSGPFLCLFSVVYKRFNFHKTTFFDLLLRHKEGFGFDLKQRFLWQELFGERVASYSPVIERTNEEIQRLKNFPLFKEFLNKIDSLCKEYNYFLDDAYIDHMQDNPSTTKLAKIKQQLFEDRGRKRKRKGQNRSKRGKSLASLPRPSRTAEITRSLYVKEKFCISDQTWIALRFVDIDVTSICWTSMYKSGSKEKSRSILYLLQ